MLGTTRPIRLDLGGDGTWAHWAGSARLDVSERRTAELRLRMESGRSTLSGWAAPSPFLHGKLQRLTAPRVLVRGNGLFTDRRLDGRLSLMSASLRLEARGLVDLRRSRYEHVAIAAELLRPPALFPNMTGRQVRLAAMLDGPFGTASFVYRLTSPHIAFDDTGFDEVRAEGRGNLSRAPVRVPLLATARRVTGVGEVVGGILANLRVQGMLEVTPLRLSRRQSAADLRQIARPAQPLGRPAHRRLRRRPQRRHADLRRSPASASSTCSPSCTRCRGRAATGRW